MKDTKIHSTAVISKEAKIGKDVEIGPFTVLEGPVTIGEGTHIATHCLIKGNTTIGKNCRIFSGAILGSSPQDLKYKGEKNYLIIGDNNTIREYTTFNPGTKEEGKTVIGNNNLFMAYSHVAHDCLVGDHCVIANGGTLAGHVTVGDRALISGLVAVHQFVRVGRLSIVGGCSKVVQDIPPFSTCDGHPARIYGLNLIGLKRNNYSRDSINKLKHAFAVLFFSGLTIRHGLSKLLEENETNPDVVFLCEFLKNPSRTISRSVRSPKRDVLNEPLESA